MKMKYGRNGLLKEIKKGEEMPVIMIDVDNAENHSMKKLWYRMLAEQCGFSKGSQKEKVVHWIIDNLDENDRIDITQRQIADTLKVSIVTVTETMSVLQKGETPFLVRLYLGAYKINPQIAYKGTEKTKKFAFIFQVSGTDDEEDDILEKADEIEEEAEEADNCDYDENDEETDETETVEEDTDDTSENESEDEPAEDEVTEEKFEEENEEENNEEQTEC